MTGWISSIISYSKGTFKLNQQPLMDLYEIQMNA